LELF